MKSNKYVIALAIACCGILTLSTNQASAQTSVVNGGFETGDFTGWAAVGSEPPIINSTTAHSGSFSADLVCTNASTNANNSEIDENTYNSGGGTINSGDVYNFSFWAYQVSNDHAGYVQNYVVSFLDGTGALLGGGTGYVPFSGGAGTWTQITANNLTAPAGAVGVYIQIYGATGANANEFGEVLIDDVSLTLAGSGGGGGGQTNQVNCAIKSGTQVSWNATSPTATYQPQSSANSNTWSNLGGLISGNTTTSLFVNAKAPFYQVLQINPGTSSGGGAVTNGSFETAGASATNAVGWSIDQAVNGTVLGIRTNDNPHSGAFDYQAYLLTTQNAGPLLEFHQTVQVTGGTTYPFSFYSDAKTGSQGYSCQYRILWSDNTDTGFINFTPGNNTYALTTVNVTAPVAATSGTVYFHIASAAVIGWFAAIDFDDVSLGSGGSSSPGSTNILSATAGRGVQVSWASGAGTNYQPQVTTTIANGGTPWANLGAVVSGNGTTNSVTDSANSPVKFYQVLQELP